jgi:hypothetical protein
MQKVHVLVDFSMPNCTGFVRSRVRSKRRSDQEQICFRQPFVLAIDFRKLRALPNRANMPNGTPKTARVILRPIFGRTAFRLWMLRLPDHALPGPVSSYIAAFGALDPKASIQVDLVTLTTRMLDAARE